MAALAGSSFLHVTFRRYILISDNRMLRIFRPIGDLVDEKNLYLKV